MHYFYLNDLSLRYEESLIIKDYAIVHQVFRVLRLKSGERIFLIDGQGLKFECSIKHINKNYIYLDILQKIECTTSKKRIIIAQSLLTKKEKMELIFQKCSELGVAGFQILNAEKSTAKYQPNFPRWQKIIIEAIEQSQRCFLPKIDFNIITLTQINQNYPQFRKIFLEPNITNSFSFVDFLKSLHQDNLLICIGPEQGWSHFEKDFAKTNKWDIININDGILRAETAAIVACGILKAFLN